HTGFYVCEGFPDYHPENPGGKPSGGRTIETGLYPFEELGDWADKITDGPYLSSYLVMTETPLGSAVPQPPSAEEIQRRSIRRGRGLGQGLVGRLLRACLDQGVELLLSHRAIDFVLEGGRVAGVTFDTPDGSRTVRANRGVVLATGGF